ncbi:MAG: formylglycine-generating enzyme family protein [Kiritimatiellae bacterium]|nr:formylglycine-generating enzyme family protein [Kiritimatiellia bacterium]
MRNTILATSLLSAMFLASFAHAESGITVSDVTYFQKGRDLVVNYRLTGDESAVVTIDILTNGFSVGAQKFTLLSGAVNTIVAPSDTTTNTIRWAARKEWPDHKIDSGVTVKVCARALTNPPDYFVLNLETGDKKWYPCVDALPDGGITNDVYKTTKLVMRRIPAGGETFTMGYPTNDTEMAKNYSYWLGRNIALPPHPVSLTDDFYMAIYEMTAKQYATVWPSQSNLADSSAQYKQSEKQPRAYVPTANIRGSNKYWPRDGHEVQTSPDRFIKLIRGIAGGVMFDLPTEAQWEFACRAGSTTLWYDNISWNGTKGVFVDGRGVCSQYMWADEWGTNLGAAQEVGLLKPNAYGLYDMHGNVAETCLDAYAGSGGPSASDGSEVIDPTGPEASDGGTYRVIKGGGYKTNKGECGSGMRSTSPNATPLEPDIGFRLVCPAVAR